MSNKEYEKLPDFVKPLVNEVEFGTGNNKPIRPKASPCIIQNDGYGNTPFQRALLFWLSIACIILFAIVFVLFMILKIKGKI